MRNPSDDLDDVFPKMKTIRAGIADLEKDCIAAFDGAIDEAAQAVVCAGFLAKVDAIQAVLDA